MKRSHTHPDFVPRDCSWVTLDLTVLFTGSGFACRVGRIAFWVRPLGVVSLLVTFRPLIFCRFAFKYLKSIPAFVDQMVDRVTSGLFWGVRNLGSVWL